MISIRNLDFIIFTDIVYFGSSIKKTFSASFVLIVCFSKRLLLFLIFSFFPVLYLIVSEAGCREISGYVVNI